MSTSFVGRQRHVWFIPLADECGVCRNNWDPLRTRAIPERLRGVFTIGAIQIHVYLYLTLPYPLSLCLWFPTILQASHWTLWLLRLGRYFCPEWYWFSGCCWCSYLRRPLAVRQIADDANVGNSCCETAVPTHAYTSVTFHPRTLNFCAM